MQASRSRVLFVDDSPYVLEGIARMLCDMEHDWDMQYAESGETALALVSHTSFDVVATDLKMPGMDGDELIQRIRTQQPAARCILLCGDADDPRALALAREGCPIIEKPCDGSEVRATIEGELRQRNRDNHEPGNVVHDNGPRSILMVDDDQDYRQSMRRLLWTVNESFPVRVVEASSGAQALEALQNEHVDCVLLDHRMPGGSGVDWISQFLDVDPYLPIVMCTGQGDEATAVNAMKQGAMDYLVKGGITAEALRCAVANAIEKMTMRKTLVEQREALLIAERHRVMIESLGSACHHLGQPMTVVTMCLDIMKRQTRDTDVQELVSQCETAAESVNEILTKLQRVGTYRTEPYLLPASDGTAPSGERILKI